MRRAYLIASLLLFAAALSLSLLHFTENRIITHADYSVSQRIAVPSILTTYTMVSDFACFGNQPCDRALAIEYGLYPRTGIPFLAALLGGFIVPFVLILTATGLAIPRRALHIPLLGIAALLFSAMMLHVPGQYFSAGSNAELDRQIASRGIYVTKVDAGMDCLGTQPCPATPYYAFTNGVFTADGVPRSLAIALGIVLPGLLLIGSVVLAFRPKPRRTPL